MERLKVPHLLQRFQEGKENVLIDLINRYHSLWRRAPFYLIREKDDYTDLIVDVLIEAWKRRESFNSEEHILGFVTQALQWKVKNLARKKSDQPISTDLLQLSHSDDHNEVPYDLLFEYELMRILSKAIRQMTGNIGRVMQLYFLKGFTLQEIPAKTNLPIEQVYTYKARGVKKLQVEYAWLWQHEIYGPLIRTFLTLFPIFFFIFC